MSKLPILIQIKTEIQFFQKIIYLQIKANMKCMSLKMSTSASSVNAVMLSSPVTSTRAVTGCRATSYSNRSMSFVKI